MNYHFWILVKLYNILGIEKLLARDTIML